MTFMHQSLARCDDTLLVKISHVMTPEPMHQVGPEPMVDFPIILRGNKVSTVSPCPARDMPYHVGDMPC